MWVSTDMPYCLDYPNQVRRPAFPFGAFPGSDEYRLWSFVTMSAMDLPKYLRKTVFGDKCIQLDSECCDASAAYFAHYLTTSCVPDLGITSLLAERAYAAAPARAPHRSLACHL
jgi:hypothetical protein